MTAKLRQTLMIVVAAAVLATALFASVRQAPWYPGSYNVVAKTADEHRKAAYHYERMATFHRDMASHHESMAYEHKKLGNTRIANHHAKIAALHKSLYYEHRALAATHREYARVK